MPLFIMWKLVRDLAPCLCESASNSPPSFIPIFLSRHHLIKHTDIGLVVVVPIAAVSFESNE